MRENKFRAWDNVEMKMYYTGEESNIHFYFDSSGIQADRFIDVEVCTPEGDKNLYADSEKLEHLKYLEYTGLKDKNGVEIYEGDILVIPIGIRTEKFLHVIKWEKETASFILEEVEEGNMTWYFDDLPYKTGEIIGNIYVNPELLEVNNGN